MPTQSAPIRRWQAAAIITVFFVAVAGAAAIGWWYARESPAHQGPIVLISVDGVPAAALSAYGGQRTDTPAIDRLAADAVIFDRAYAHSPQTLPAHASILTGQLPLQHGVRDDAGFTLTREVTTLAEMLRNRGFNTGAAVSSFLLRPESGIAQGFTYFDAEQPDAESGVPPTLARDGAATIDAAERWIRTQDGRRFFLFVQVDRRDADIAVTRLSSLLRDLEFYDGSTVVLVGDHGDGTADVGLDDAVLRIPLLVKQPDRAGAGRRVAAPVQQIDLAPTLLDLVRAPIPDQLRGRSLRAVLDGAETGVPEQPVYSESLSARYRFGGRPIYALTSATHRYVRGIHEELIALTPGITEPRDEPSADTARLSRELDRLLDGSDDAGPDPLAAADEERYASIGYLAAPRVPAGIQSPLTADDQVAIAEAHRAAAHLIGQKKYSAGIRALQAIVRDHPDLTVVHYQLGLLLARTGRLEEAIDALRTARELQPDAADLALALTDALMRAGQIDAAQEQADEAISLAEHGEAGQRAAAHEVAARVALARNDAAAATKHAMAAHDARPSTPFRQFVRGRLFYEEGEYEKALEAFEEAAGTARQGHEPVADLHLYLGESLAHLDRYPEAETQYREELRLFPRNIQAYTALAMLYRASNRDAALEEVLNELVSATPTPEGYAVAVKLWTILGDPSRAEALRSDARARFRGDPSLALLGRDGRR